MGKEKTLLELWKRGEIHVMPSEDWEMFKPEPLTEEDKMLAEELFKNLAIEGHAQPL